MSLSTARRPASVAGAAVVVTAVVAGAAILLTPRTAALSAQTSPSSAGSSSGSLAGPSSGSVGGAGSVGAMPLEPVVVGDAANGSIVRLRSGQSLRVVLGSPSAAGSTAWSFLSLGSGVLGRLDGPTVTAQHDAPGCGRPGAGCGTVTLTLVGRTPGTAQLNAIRTSCGEAVRCPAGKGDFLLTVVVN